MSAVLGNLFGEPFKMAGGWSVDGVLRKSPSLLVGVIFFCVGIPFLILGVQYLRLEHLLAKHGITVEGIAHEKFVDRNVHLVRYRFTTAGGVTLESTDNVHESLWESIKEGGRVKVRYLKGAPDTNRIEGNISTKVLGTGFSLMGGVLVLLGGVALVRAYKKVLRQARLSREGVVVEGTAVGLRMASLKIDEVQQWAIRYTYRDDRGTVHEADSEPLSFEEAQTWRQGDKCRVMMNPKIPEESYWAGRAEGDEAG
jgi:hypothetical protein